MTSILRPTPSFDCRSCGARHIPESAEHSLCEACDGVFERWRFRTGKPEGSVNAWLARRLALDVARLKKFGVTGRCEGLSQGMRGWLDGFGNQCRLPAVAFREGRRVCGQHQTSNKITFVGDVSHDAYRDMERLMTELATVDDRFRDCLARALAALTT